MATDISVIHAYRHLYRGLLRAVMYTTPQRFLVRDELRSAFRSTKATFDPLVVKRTIWFIDAAAKETGLEHKIIKNLLHVRMRKHAGLTKWNAVYQQGLSKNKVKGDPFQHYRMTIAMLNESMGICLR